MATHKLFPSFNVHDLEGHLSSLVELARLTRQARERLSETERLLNWAVQETTAAFKLATLYHNQNTGRLEAELKANPTLVSLNELARELGVTTNTIRTMRADGRLPEPVKVSSRKLAFRRQDIEAWLDRGGAKRKAA